MGIDPLTRAVFLDRDGVLNPNVLNPATGAWESPHKPEDFRLYSHAIENAMRLRDAGYLLFLVSNQPSYAKGKTSLENIRAIAAALEVAMAAAGVKFSAYYYCLHHPDGIVPDYSGACACRKPSPYFLHKAQKDFNVDLAASWMVGDRDTDIRCGQAAGTRTVFIRPDHPGAKDMKAVPDFMADNLVQAVDLILSSHP